MAYLSLFFAALLAATLFPAQSEALLGALVLQQNYNVFSLWLVATFGNVLGSLINWYLGWHIDYFQGKSWFPFKTESLTKARERFQRYGKWSLLLSWMPVIGDPLTLIAGVLHLPFWQFVGIVTLAKAGRYLLLIAIVLGYST